MKEKIILYLLKCKEDLFRIITVGINNCHSRGEKSGLTFYFLKFFWSSVALQCCVNFCCIAKLYVYMYPLSFGFTAYLGLHRALSRVPGAVEQVLIITYFIHSVLVCIGQSHSPSSSSPRALPPWYPLCLFSASVSLSVLCK